MDPVGVTVDLSRYRCMVHYVTCSYYRTTHTHLNLEIPPSAKWKLCSHCRPKKQDIVTIAHDIKWLEKSGDVMNLAHTYGTGMLLSLSDTMEHHVAQRELTGASVVRDRYR